VARAFARRDYLCVVAYFVPTYMINIFDVDVGTFLHKHVKLIKYYNTNMQCETQFAFLLGLLFASEVFGYLFQYKK
jgi:hypothetical protein